MANNRWIVVRTKAALVPLAFLPFSILCLILCVPGFARLPSGGPGFFLCAEPVHKSGYGGVPVNDPGRIRRVA